MDTSWLVSCLWCNDDSSKANDEKKGFPSTVDDKRKRESPHVETSREEILHVLKKHMVARGTSILEIGSGTGQHCAYFAKELPRVTFQPSETTGYASPHFEATDVAVSLSSIDAWCEQLGNVKPALEIDASSKDQWPVKQKSFNALLAINLMHICTEDARRGLFQHASDVLLPSRGLIFIYGPFSTDQETSLSDSNKAFDTILRSKKSGKNKEQEMWGIQSVQQIDTIANHFEFERIALEAASPTYDNVTLVYAKCSH